MKKYSAVLLLFLLLAGVFPAKAQDNLTNLALQKPVTAGNYSATHHKDHLVDGDTATYVDQTGTLTDNESGTAANYNNADNWYQIDLGKKYYFDHIVLHDDTSFWSSVYHIRILASETEDFSQKTVLYESGEFVEVPLPLTVAGDGNCYRYVRLEKVNTSMNLEYQYTELEVWGDENNAEEEIPVVLENAALLKPVTAGRYIDSTTKDDINDGNDNTGVYYVPTGTKTDNPDGILAEPQNDWYQIDMGERYLVDHIILKRGAQNWMTAQCFKIMVSNSSDFSDGTQVTLFEVGEGAGAAFPLTVAGDGNYYRYVRLQRTGLTSYESYTELEVWSSGALRTTVNAIVTGNQSLDLSFGRDMDFSLMNAISVFDQKSGQPVSCIPSVSNEKTLALNFSQELNSSAVVVKFPGEMKSLDEIPLDTLEIVVSFPPIIVINNFNFINGSEAGISQLAGEAVVGFKLDVVNQTQTLSDSCVIILAFYQGANLVSVSDVRISVAPGQTQSVSLTADISQKNADSACVYIWNNYTNALTVNQTFELQ